MGDTAWRAEHDICNSFVGTDVDGFKHIALDFVGKVLQSRGGRLITDLIDPYVWEILGELVEEWIFVRVRPVR